MLLKRPRRLRKTPQIRRLVAENCVHSYDLILPLFIKEGLTKKKPIYSMPGHYQLSLNDLEEEIESIQKLKINTVILFGIPKQKDDNGSRCCGAESVVQKAIRAIKSKNKGIVVISDLCFCEYTTHGHCGILKNFPYGVDVDNDQTLKALQKQALSHAEAGADIIAPSGMMDGMVISTRRALDEKGYTYIPILSYAAKYASSFYGPFREAVEGAPQFGDRSTYQMDVSNGAEAILEAGIDLEESADMLMVKPGHTYLDILWRIKQVYPSIPVGAYHPSGEFAMLKAASKQGYLNEKEAVREVLTSMKRAGADFIITYYAKEYCQWFNQ